LVAHPKPDLGKKTVDPDFVDESHETVTGAESSKRLVSVGGASSPAGLRLVMCQQTIDFGLGNAMVTSFRARGAHVASVDPALERGVANAQTRGGGSHREECHENTFPEERAGGKIIERFDSTKANSRIDMR
jgi:hypothetical protein